MRRHLAALLTLLVGLVGPAGCGALRRAPLDVPPGHRVVLGRVELSGFEATEAIFQIVKEDLTVSHDLRTGRWEDFIIILPPGRYRVVRLSAFKDTRQFPNDPVWDLRLAFEVGPEPAAYIGTLRLTAVFNQRPRAEVVDNYEETVRVLRTRHPDLPEPIARRLLTGS